MKTIERPIQMTLEDSLPTETISGKGLLKRLGINPERYPENMPVYNAYREFGISPDQSGYNLGFESLNSLGYCNVLSFNNHRDIVRLEAYNWPPLERPALRILKKETPDFDIRKVIPTEEDRRMAKKSERSVFQLWMQRTCGTNIFNHFWVHPTPSYSELRIINEATGDSRYFFEVVSPPVIEDWKIPSLKRLAQAKIQRIPKRLHPPKNKEKFLQGRIYESGIYLCSSYLYLGQTDFLDEDVFVRMATRIFDTYHPAPEEGEVIRNSEKEGLEIINGMTDSLNYGGLFTCTKTSPNSPFYGLKNENT